MSGSTHTILISFFIAILSIVAITCPAQDYIQYHKTFNKIDEDILSENYTRAIERLDSIYENYNFIFAQHCMKALQICCITNDSTRASRWLEKCFKQGIPLWTVRTNENRFLIPLLQTRYSITIVFGLYTNRTLTAN